MKTFLLITFLFFVSIQCHSQSAIEIKYQRFTFVEYVNDSIAETPAFFMPRMVYNDSFALVYFFSKKYNYRLPKKQIGNKMLHHGIFYNFITGEKSGEILWPGKKKYFLKDTAKSHNWQFFDEERIVLNKVCHAALSVKKNGDRILVWYTKDLPFKNGPLFYDSIPGVVLEVFDQTWQQHFIATEINEIEIKIVPLDEGTGLTHAELQKMRDEKSLKENN